MGCGGGVSEPVYDFYHWETELAVNDSLLGVYGSERLYIKAFDVSWSGGRAEPAAILSGGDSVGVEAVPVVFITNEVFERAGAGLAEEVYGLLERSFPFPFDELQVDCDWTAGTQVQYFEFLDEIATRSGKRVSCTVRLHQYRDRELQGIPPVGRVVLMAYNTGDLGSWETDNSIVDPLAVDYYIAGQPPYPLPLDLAVPVYDWAAVYRRGELAYLINEPELVGLADTSRFTALAPLRYRVDSSTYYEGLYLYRGDLLRREIADRASAMELVDDLWPQVANKGSRRVIFYRMGSRGW